MVKDSEMKCWVMSRLEKYLLWVGLSNSYHIKPGVVTCIWNPSFGVVETRRFQGFLASPSRQWVSTEFRKRQCFKRYGGERYRKALSKDAWLPNTYVHSHTVIQEGKEAYNIERVVSYFGIVNFSVTITVKAGMRTAGRSRWSSENAKHFELPRRLLLP